MPRPGGRTHSKSRALTQEECSELRRELDSGKTSDTDKVRNPITKKFIRIGLGVWNKLMEECDSMDNAIGKAGTLALVSGGDDDIMANATCKSATLSLLDGGSVTPARLLGTVQGPVATALQTLTSDKTEQVVTSFQEFDQVSTSQASVKQEKFETYAKALKSLFPSVRQMSTLLIVGAVIIVVALTKGNSDRTNMHIVSDVNNYIKIADGTVDITAHGVASASAVSDHVQSSQTFTDISKGLRVTGAGATEVALASQRADTIGTVGSLIEMVLAERARAGMIAVAATYGPGVALATSFLLWCSMPPLGKSAAAGYIEPTVGSLVSQLKSSSVSPLEWVYPPETVVPDLYGRAAWM